jgi:hypothetical protein
MMAIFQALYTIVFHLSRLVLLYVRLSPLSLQGLHADMRS